MVERHFRRREVAELERLIGRYGVTSITRQLDWTGAATATRYYCHLDDVTDYVLPEQQRGEH